MTTRQKVERFTKSGLTPREIAAVMGISTQRVYQLLKELGLEPARPKKSEASA